MTSAPKFERDLKLDANMVLAGMQGGKEGFMAYAFARRDVFANPGEAIARAEWFKRQPESYVKEVCDRAVQIEKGQS